MPAKSTERSSPLPGRPVRGSKSGRSINALLDLLGRSKAMRLIWELRDGRPLRFRELALRCDASPSVLNTRLKELRYAAIIEHTRADGYKLTPHGCELLAHFLPIYRWANDWERNL